jgi:hypothetical protein
LQEIGFFSTSLSFVFLPALILITANSTKAGYQARSFIIFGIITAALSLTLPYLYIQYLPTLVVLILIALLFKKYLKTDYLKHLVVILIISIIGFFVAFGHVYLQTKILKRATNFPAMELTYLDNGEIIKTDNYQIDSVSSDGQNTASLSDNTLQEHSAGTQVNDFFKKLKQTDIFVQYITPMSNIAWNAFMIKNVRMPNNVLSLGAYLWIVLSVILIPISIIKKNMIFYTISVFSLVFGISTQFGILEISTYRGRSGWYLMLLTSIGLAFIIDYIIANKIDGKKLILPAIIALGVVGIIKPPVYYRPYYVKPYEIIRSIVKKSPEASISIITRDKHISVLSDNISAKVLEDNAIKEPCAKDICLLVVENELTAVDPVLSQQASAIDKNFQAFAKQQNEERLKNAAQIQKIKSMPEFKSYKLYWRNSDIEIFKYESLHK